MNGITDRKILAGVGGAALLSAAVVSLYLLNPQKSSLFPPCPFNYFTGLYCPGCGSLRAVHLLLHGRVAEALAMNPLMVLLLPFFPILYVKRSFLYLTRVPWIVLIVFLLYGILRNLPYWPYNLLAPH